MEWVQLSPTLEQNMEDDKKGFKCTLSSCGNRPPTPPSDRRFTPVVGRRLPESKDRKS